MSLRETENFSGANKDLLNLPRYLIMAKSILYTIEKKSWILAGRRASDKR